jgi:predicted nucleic acid-binding protein
VTYLLDTNAISDLIRGAAGIESWLSSAGQEDRVVTCAIVRGEVLFGIAKLPEGKRRRGLEERVRPLLG